MSVDFDSETLKNKAKSKTANKNSRIILLFSGCLFFFVLEPTDKLHEASRWEQKKINQVRTGSGHWR